MGSPVPDSVYIILNSPTSTNDSNGKEPLDQATTISVFAFGPAAGAKKSGFTHCFTSVNNARAAIERGNTMSDGIIGIFSRLSHVCITDEPSDNITTSAFISLTLGIVASVLTV